MNILNHLNAAMEYIEENLCAELDLDEVAVKACISADSFLRFFSYMTGMTLKEYVRCRRLTLAAEDLRLGQEKIVDLAVKYGYDSSAAFSRAFAKQHGLMPNEYRKYGGTIKVFPPASFHITIKGAKEMKFRIVELEETTVYGIAKEYEGQGYPDRETLRHLMWSEECENVSGKLAEGNWNQPGSKAYDGIWYGVWQDGKYLIARDEKDIKKSVSEKEEVEVSENANIKDRLERYYLKAGTYAAFKTEAGGLAWEEFPKLFELIFESWLPASGYTQKGDAIIEVYHLWTDKEERKKKRYYEVWVPVEKK